MSPACLPPSSLNLSPPLRAQAHSAPTSHLLSYCSWKMLGMFLPQGLCLFCLLCQAGHIFLQKAVWLTPCLQGLIQTSSQCGASGSSCIYLSIYYCCCSVAKSCLTLTFWLCGVFVVALELSCPTGKWDLSSSRSRT